MLCPCLILCVNKVYFNFYLIERESDRQSGNVSLCFPCRLFLHLTTFNPHRPHDINYSLHPETPSECVWVSEWVHVCTAVHVFMPFLLCVFVCVDSYWANNSFIPLTVSTAFTVLFNPFFFYAETWKQQWNQSVFKTQRIKRVCVRIGI